MSVKKRCKDFEIDDLFVRIIDRQDFMKSGFSVFMKLWNLACAESCGILGSFFFFFPAQLAHDY